MRVIFSLSKYIDCAPVGTELLQTRADLIEPNANALLAVLQQDYSERIFYRSLFDLKKLKQTNCFDLVRLEVLQDSHDFRTVPIRSASNSAGLSFRRNTQGRNAVHLHRF